MNSVELAYHRSMLYDFYGDLLTEHQRSVYDAFVNEDISISEIASMHDKSRQSVHDLIKRIDKILEGYEDKLHLLSLFTNMKDKLSELDNELISFKSDKDMAHVDRVLSISEEMAKTL